MPTECQITFPNNVEKVFYGGQSLVGRVDLSLTNSKTVRGKNNSAKKRGALNQ